ncbi:MAG: OmpA family protein, partial [Paludibacteraceae bacterium]|nr:OmpA family protein [Paludibacteraceae bacterium]
DTLLYFASNRGGGYGGLDIYVSRLKTITRESTDTTTGQVNKEELEIWDTPVHLDSVFNSSSNDYNMIGSPKIYLFMSNRTGGKGSDDIYRPAPFVATREPELVPDFTIDEPKGFHWVLMFFDFNVATMKPEYEAQLDELVSAMNEFPGAIFEISGHTDARGSDTYNIKLSQKRADYIKGMLINRGLDPSKLVSVGRGFHDPVIPNAQSEAEHEQNRRADIKILNE